MEALESWKEEQGRVLRKAVLDLGGSINTLEIAINLESSFGDMDTEWSRELVDKKDELKAILQVLHRLA